MGPMVPAAPDRSTSPIIIYARELDAGKTTQGEIQGDVELFRMDQHLSTQQIFFDPVNESVSLPGAVAYEDQQVWISENCPDSSRKL